VARKSKQPGDDQVLFARLREVWTDLTMAHWLAIVRELAPGAGFARSGIHIKGRCPLHRHPGSSFVITPEKGMAKCFGCHRTFFHPLALVAELRNASAPSMADALLVLRRRFGLQGVTEALYDRLREHEVEQGLKSRLCRFFGDELLDAIAAYPMERSRDYAWARPAVEYLLGRRLVEDAPNEVAGDLDDRRGATDADPHGIWPAITSNQLLGIFPTEARVVDRFGTASEEHRFFRQHFGFLAADGFGFAGYLVVPLHDEPGSVRRFKLRAPSVETEAAFFVDDAFEAEVGGFRGFYGLHYYRSSLGLELLDGASYADTAVVMEGELDALASIAHQIRGQAHFVALAVAGATVPMLDQLAAYGIEHVRVVGDREGRGASLVDRALEAVTPASRVAVSTLDWPDEYVAWRDPTDPERRIHGPEAAVRRLGYARWAGHVTSGAHYRALPAAPCGVPRRGQGHADLQLRLFDGRAPGAATMCSATMAASRATSGRAR
jgi:hypothetical protein